MTPRDGSMPYWLLLPSNAGDGLHDAELAAVGRAIRMIKWMLTKAVQTHDRDEDDVRLLMHLERAERKLGLAVGMAEKRAG